MSIIGEGRWNGRGAPDDLERSDERLLALAARRLTSMERAAAAIWDGGPGPWFGMVHHLGAALTELGLDGAQASGPVAVVPLSQRGLLGALDDVDDLLCRIIVTTRATERRLSCGRARTQLDLCRDVLAELPS